MQINMKDGSRLFIEHEVCTGGEGDQSNNRSQAL